MCKFCIGRIKKCPCRGHITTQHIGESPKLSKKSKIINQKGAFGQ